MSRENWYMFFAVWNLVILLSVLGIGIYTGVRFTELSLFIGIVLFAVDEVIRRMDAIKDFGGYFVGFLDYHVLKWGILGMIIGVIYIKIF